MSIRISISGFVGMRLAVPDHTLLDYLDLAVITPEPGIVATSALTQRWNCSQSTVSRRMAAVAAAGLAEITSAYGNYHVHWLKHAQS